MKTILTFEYDSLDHDQRLEAEMRLKAPSYAMFIDDVYQYLRSRLKYEELSTEVHEALDLLRSEMVRLQQDHELPFD